MSKFQGDGLKTRGLVIIFVKVTLFVHHGQRDKSRWAGSNGCVLKKKIRFAKVAKHCVVVRIIELSKLLMLSQENPWGWVRIPHLSFFFLFCIGTFRT